MKQKAASFPPSSGSLPLLLPAPFPLLPPPPFYGFILRIVLIQDAKLG